MRLVPGSSAQKNCHDPTGVETPQSISKGSTGSAASSVPRLPRSQHLQVPGRSPQAAASQTLYDRYSLRRAI